MQTRLPSIPGFDIGRKLGSGAFGQVYRAVHLASRTEVAAKVVTDPTRCAALRSEARVYEAVQGQAGFASVLAAEYGPDLSFLVLSLLGQNLRDIGASVGPFSLRTVLMIADQILCSLQYLHLCGFVDCDVTPDNICVGSGSSSNSIFLIDLGLAVTFGRPLPPGEKGRLPFRGTPAFASVAAHEGRPPMPKDDIESLMYTLIYLLKGELPWMTNDDRDRIFSIKCSIDPRLLFERIPDEFRVIYQEVRQMGMDRKPEYARYRKMLRDLFLRCNFVFDYKYDWIELRKTTFGFQGLRSSASTKTMPRMQTTGPRQGLPPPRPKEHSRSPLPRAFIPRRL
jgi:serine/threonine protein kinase